MKNRPSGRALAAAGVVMLLASSAAGRDHFLTNLALLDQLTRDAVRSLLDSLDVRPGEPVTLLPATGHEGNEFVADAFARELAHRGVEVRLAQSQAPSEPAASGSQNGNQTPAGGSQSTPANRRTPNNRLLSENFPEGLISGAGDSMGAPADTSFLGGESDSLHVSEEGEEDENSSGADHRREQVRRTGEAGDTTAAPSTGQAAVAIPMVKAYPEGAVLEYKILEFGVSYPSIKRRYLFFGGASVGRLGGVYLQATRIEGSSGTILDVATGQSHAEDRLSAHSRALAEGSSYPFVKPSVPPANLGRYIEPLAVLGIVTSLVYLFYQNQN